MPGRPDTQLVLGTRRLVHLVLLALIVIGVRACGGLPAAEDRLGVASRWMAEKAGVTRARDAWNTSVGPMSEAVWNAIDQRVSLALDTAGTTADGMAAWIADRLSKTASAIWSAGRSLLTPNRTPQPAPSPAEAPPPVKEDSAAVR